MPDVYGLCQNNCRYPVYTQEQMLSILQQMIDAGSLQGIKPDDSPVVALIRESNKNADVSLWVGSMAEYNALAPAAGLVTARIDGASGKVYFCTDDTMLEDWYRTITEESEQIAREIASEVVNGKQNEIKLVGLLKGDGASVVAAEAGVDYAPAYSGYVTITSSLTLSASHFGKCLLVDSASALTITLPTATSGMLGAEIEIDNIGAGTITLTGALRIGANASTSASVTVETSDAVTLKCIGTAGGAWLVIGNYSEA